MVCRKEKGQAMAEFALMIPVLILLLFGMTFAAFYAFRSASTDWGVFITGVRMPGMQYCGQTWQTGYRQAKVDHARFGP
jgi:ABC-type sugar transport system permease subunit